MNQPLFNSNSLKARLIPIGICLCLGAAVFSAFKGVLNLETPVANEATTEEEALENLASLRAVPENQDNARANLLTENQLKPVGTEQLRTMQKAGNTFPAQPTWTAPQPTNPLENRANQAIFKPSNQLSIPAEKTSLIQEGDLDDLLNVEIAARNQQNPEQAKPQPSQPAPMSTSVLDREFDATLRPSLSSGQAQALTTTPASMQPVETNQWPTPNRPNHSAIHAIPKTVASQVKRHLDYGRALARRGSTFSATNEFIHGLKLIAQVWDYQSNSTDFTSSLDRALVALDEMEDFLVSDNNVRKGIQAYGIMAAHQSRVMSETEARQASSIEALQRYMRYSQESFADAAGNDPLASELFYAWGKLQLTLASQGAAQQLNHTKAIVLFRSAYTSDNGNILAANELAVMLARNGNLEVAKNLLIQSLRQNPLAMGWKNLSMIHSRLNEREMAQRAWNEYQIMTNDRVSQSAGNQARWISPKQFNQMQGGYEYSPTQKANVQTANQFGYAQPGEPTRKGKPIFNVFSNDKNRNQQPASGFQKGFGYGTEVPQGTSKPRSAKQPGIMDKIKSIF